MVVTYDGPLYGNHNKILTKDDWREDMQHRTTILQQRLAEVEDKNHRLNGVISKLTASLDRRNRELRDALDMVRQGGDNNNHPHPITALKSRPTSPVTTGYKHRHKSSPLLDQVIQENTLLRHKVQTLERLLTEKTEEVDRLYRNSKLASLQEAHITCEEYLEEVKRMNDLIRFQDQESHNQKQRLHPSYYYYYYYNDDFRLNTELGPAVAIQAQRAHPKRRQSPSPSNAEGRPPPPPPPLPIIIEDNAQQLMSAPQVELAEAPEVPHMKPLGACQTHQISADPMEPLPMAMMVEGGGVLGVPVPPLPQRRPRSRSPPHLRPSLLALKHRKDKAEKQRRESERLTYIQSLQTQAEKATRVQQMKSHRKEKARIEAIRRRRLEELEAELAKEQQEQMAENDLQEGTLLPDTDKSKQEKVERMLGKIREKKEQAIQQFLQAKKEWNDVKEGIDEGEGDDSVLYGSAMDPDEPSPMPVWTHTSLKLTASLSPTATIPRNKIDHELLADSITPPHHRRVDQCSNNLVDSLQSAPDVQTPQECTWASPVRSLAPASAPRPAGTAHSNNQSPGRISPRPPRPGAVSPKPSPHRIASTTPTTTNTTSPKAKTPKGSSTNSSSNLTPHGSTMMVLGTEISLSPQLPASPHPPLNASGSDSLESVGSVTDDLDLILQPPSSDGYPHSSGPTQPEGSSVGEEDVLDYSRSVSIIGEDEEEEESVVFAGLQSPQSSSLFLSDNLDAAMSSTRPLPENLNLSPNRVMDLASHGEGKHVKWADGATSSQNNNNDTDSQVMEDSAVIAKGSSRMALEVVHLVDSSDGDNNNNNSSGLWPRSRHRSSRYHSPPNGGSGHVGGRMNDKPEAPAAVTGCGTLMQDTKVCMVDAPVVKGMEDLVITGQPAAGLGMVAVSEDSSSEGDALSEQSVVGSLGDDDTDGSSLQGTGAMYVSSDEEEEGKGRDDYGLVLKPELAQGYDKSVLQTETVVGREGPKFSGGNNQVVLIEDGEEPFDLYEGFMD